MVGHIRQRRPKWQPRMDNPEKQATLCTLDTRRGQIKENKRKNTTQYVLDTTMRKETQIT